MKVRNSWILPVSHDVHCLLRLVTEACAVFVTAAGFASASVLYNIPDAPFTHDQYTIAPFQVRLPTYRSYSTMSYYVSIAAGRCANQYHSGDGQYDSYQE
jgi:hypothetical protein